MLKGALQFGLTRRPIILLALLVFLAGGLLAFRKLNIEAYPNPAPVILEITAQAPGLSAEEMERYYTIPMEIGLTPRRASMSSAPPRSMACPLSASPSNTAWITTSPSTSRGRLQQNVNLPGNVTAAHSGTSSSGKSIAIRSSGPRISE